MQDQYSRTQLLLGAEAMEKLKGARVAVFGIGGVGGYVCEGLVRSGVGAFDLVDDDKVCLTNLNRQIIATRKTVGKYKVDVMRERMLEINPDCDVRVHKCFYLPETAAEFNFSDYDYVVDAVDTVTAKVTLVLEAQKAGVPIISCMGAGNKLDPSRFRVADIYKTQGCPLARVMRTALRKPTRSPPAPSRICPSAAAATASARPARSTSAPSGAISPAARPSCRRSPGSSSRARS